MGHGESPTGNIQQLLQGELYQRVSGGFIMQKLRCRLRVTAWRWARPP